MSHAKRAYPSFFLLILLLAGVTGCSGEQGERKAFVEFLQTRIIDQPGLRVPKLTDADKKSLGQYASQYAVIGDFNEHMGEAFNAASPAIQTIASLSTPQELMKGQSRIAEARAALTKVEGQLAAELVQTQATRARLSQPDDLKAVYQAAFDKTVVRPSELMLKVLEQTDGILADAQGFAVFLQENQTSLSFVGSQVEVRSPAMLEKLNAHLGALNDKRQKLMELQGELGAMVGG
ncbi:MAG: DUF3053 family protein [Pseudoxanthomonas sp.]